MIGAGLIGGLAAAVPGWLDWFGIPSGTRAKRIGLLHGVGNVIVLALFILSWVLRRDNPEVPPTGAIVAGVLGFVLAAFTGWLGGELVDRLGVGVDQGAHLDAPSSLSELPARARAGSSPGSRVYGGTERRASPPVAYAGVDRRAGPHSASFAGRLSRLIACSRRSADDRSITTSQYTNATGNRVRV